MRSTFSENRTRNKREIIIKKILKISSTMYSRRDLFQTKGKHVGLHQKKSQDSIKELQFSSIQMQFPDPEIVLAQVVDELD